MLLKISFVIVPTITCVSLIFSVIKIYPQDVQINKSHSSWPSSHHHLHIRTRFATHAIFRSSHNRRSLRRRRGLAIVHRLIKGYKVVQWHGQLLHNATGQVVAVSLALLDYGLRRTWRGRVLVRTRTGGRGRSSGGQLCAAHDGHEGRLFRPRQQ